MSGTAPKGEIEVPPGLEGVVVCETAISEVNGSKGELSYRGVPLQDLVGRMTYEDLVPWLVGIPRGSDPEPVEVAMRPSPASEKAAGLLPMETLAATMLAEASLWHQRRPASVHAYLQAVRERFGARVGHALYHDRGSGSARYLAAVTGSWPSPAAQQALDAYWVMAAEHGLNASTFAVRVAASTGATLPMALTAGVATLSGPLHGGAPEGVLDLLEEAAEDPEHIDDRLLARLNRGERLMGFGHRVYRQPDPRAEALRAVLADLSRDDPGTRQRLDLAMEVERHALQLLERLKPNRPLYTNVEFYAAAVLSAVGIPKTLCPPTFALARTAGWAAHYVEQQRAGRLIRPQSRYAPAHAG